MMSFKKNFYKSLGLQKNATLAEVQKAYREAARHLHPDVNTEAGATEHFIHIKEAYETLSNPQKRQTYDKDFETDILASLPIRVETQFSRSALRYSSEPQYIYALISMDIMQNVKQASSPPSPLNIALILDTSTSMQGTRLEIVKASAIELLRQLRPQDMASIIAFDDRAFVVLEASSHTNIRHIESRIHSLQASGGTEIFKGLEAGFSELQRFYQPRYTNQMILITDGHTYGDEEASLQLADKAAEQDIGITCLGIGGEWNDRLLDELTARTGGYCAYVQKPRDIYHLLTNKINSLGKTLAERINLHFELGPGVDLQFALRLKPEASILPTKSPLRLGSLPGQSQQQILLEFIVQPLPKAVQQALLITGELTFDIPTEDKSYQLPFYLARSVERVALSETPPVAIRKALSSLNLYRMQEQAQHEISQGEYNQAQRRLKNVATQLLSQGEDKLASAIFSEIEHLQSTHSISSEGRKRIKYGTRALLLPDGKKQDSEI